MTKAVKVGSATHFKLVVAGGMCEGGVRLAVVNIDDVEVQAVFLDEEEVIKLMRVLDAHATIAECKRDIEELAGRLDRREELNDDF